MQNPRIVIATPSVIEQSRLEKALLATNKAEILAIAKDLSQAYMRIEELMPDYVLIASSFTRFEEFHCMLGLFRAVEARVVYIAGDMSEPAGMADFGPLISPRQSGAEILETLARAPVQRAPVRATTAAPLPPSVTQPRQSVRMVLIGASTGGIDALTTILAHFPPDAPSTAIVQHTGQSYSETLVRLLDRRCAADVVLAESGVEMQTGRVCLGAGIDGHLRLTGKGKITCQVQRGPATSGHLPSIDEMFMSAVPYAQNVVAVLLTGMGRDGANGLLALRKAGAITIGQDQASSVVYGMPRVANEIGAVQHQLPLPQIGPAIMQFASAASAQKARAIV